MKQLRGFILSVAIAGGGIVWAAGSNLAPAPSGDEGGNSPPAPAAAPAPARATIAPAVSAGSSNVAADADTPAPVPAKNLGFLFDEGKKAVKAGQYQIALGYFTQADRAEPHNPSVLNMLAFCQRKTGNLDAALENYKVALEIQPHFPEAREYLGEAYIQAALRELATLKSYGAEGKEGAAEIAATLLRAAAALKQ